ncbi:epoxide hydrolase family protein [Kitasatospora brasiliensis]|uniref:epoxide hydrolase family protein n=1 Tax=Kitasatospora brasiliensis TaxID=3058040 RepID=UPI00292E32F4|nr:epoxide hydrolase [Kitasatospora sp. K002]
MASTPFRIDIPEPVLDDLRHRLRSARLPKGRSGQQPWAAGTDPAYLAEVVAHWADGFDWAERQRELNALPHFLTEVDGTVLHYLHVRGVRAEGAPAPLPLILNHGWPSSFVEMLSLVPLLTDPAAHGGDAADAFDVVIPSLPGFLWSQLPAGPLTRGAMAELFHRLMTEELGYRRYGVFGGDIGGSVGYWMAARHPEQVVGAHLIHPPVPHGAHGADLSEAEQAFLAWEEEYDEGDDGYSSIQATRPDTLAAALLDSPAGLAAWLLDKYRDWTDCSGDLEKSIDRDVLLTVLTLYWATASIDTSFRSYYDYGHNEPRPPLTVPAGFTISREPVMRDFPRELSERCCADIRHWHEAERGGHFLPLEEPRLMARELRTFFGPLRATAV